METILIKPELLELVKEGKKVTTCRNGIRTYQLGKTILKSNESEDFVYININELKYYKLKDITDDMAKDDGFDNIENLIEVLHLIYGEITDESDMTIVCFTLCENQKKQTDMEVYLKLYDNIVINATNNWGIAYEWFSEEDNINIQIWLDGASLIIRTEELLEIYNKHGFFDALEKENNYG